MNYREAICQRSTPDQTKLVRLDLMEEPPFDSCEDLERPWRTLRATRKSRNGCRSLYASALSSPWENAGPQIQFDRGKLSPILNG